MLRLCLTAIFFLVVSILFANNDTMQIKLKPVTIISSKRIDNPFNLPQSINIINQDNIIANTNNSLYDISKNSTGLNFSSDGIWGVNPIIRGLSPNNSHIYIDGIKIETSNEISASASLINLNDIDKIEILKGAVNSYYGSGAIGGIIYIVSSKPTFTEKFQINTKINTLYQTNNNLHSEDLSFNFSSPNLVGKITYGQRNAQNAKNSLSEIANSSFKDKYFSSYFNLKINNLLISTNFQYYLGDDIGIPGTGSLFPINAKVYYDKISRTLVNLNFTYNDISKYIPYIKLNLSLQNIDRYVINQPNISQTTSKAKIITEKITPVGLHSTKSFNIESIFEFNKSNSLVYGIDIWRRDLDTKRERFIRIDSLKPDKTIYKTVYRYQKEIPIPKSHYDNYGLWYSFKNTNGLVENLVTEFAGRIDYIFIKNNFAVSPEVDILDSKSIINPAKQLKWKEQSSENISWSVSLNNLYQFSDFYKIGLNLSRTYRIPNLEERYQYIEQGNLVKLGNIDLKPEEGLYYELVQKFNYNDIKTNLSFYRYDFKNLVADEFRKKYFVRAPGDTVDAYVKSNIGKAYIFGTEYDIAYKNIANLINLYTNITFIVGKDKNTKQYLPKLPPLYGRFSLEILPIDNLSILYSLDFASKALNVPKSEPNTAGYGINNIVISYNFELFNTQSTFVVGCNNIFDKLYKNHLSTYRGYYQYEIGRNIYSKLSIQI